MDELRGGVSHPDVINGYIKCEMDGIPMGGVRHITVVLDRDGNRCLMLFTDIAISAHLIGQDGPVSPTACRTQS